MSKRFVVCKNIILLFYLVIYNGTKLMNGMALSKHLVHAVCTVYKLQCLTGKLYNNNTLLYTILKFPSDKFNILD